MLEARGHLPRFYAQSADRQRDDLEPKSRGYRIYRAAFRSIDASNHARRRLARLRAKDNTSAARRQTPRPSRPNFHTGSAASKIHRTSSPATLQRPMKRGGTLIEPTVPTNLLRESQVSRLPLAVRTALDVQALRTGVRALRRLPGKTLTVALDGVDPGESQRFEARVRAYIRACGCAEGGVAALIGIGAMLTWGLVPIFQRGPRLRDLLVVIAALPLGALLGGAGKLIGLGMARRRFVSSCDEIIRLMKNKT
jgi:hypothetical protein